MTTTDYYEKYKEAMDYFAWEKKLRSIGWDVLEPTFMYAGTFLNALVFCIWMFGPKSKSLCCATYFTANAVADFLLLTIRPIIRGTWIIRIPGRESDIACKLKPSLLDSTIQVSTWISATITVERALTIVLPFKFKSQDMSRRSKYIVAIIIVMQPFTQIVSLINRTSKTDPDIDYTFCGSTLFDEWNIEESLHLWFAIAIPFLVIIFFNLATITALCRNRFQQHTVSGNRDHVLVFTKITIMTGVSFVLSYFMYFYKFIIWISDSLWYDGTVRNRVYVISTFLDEGMVYVNSCMNPIICLVVCRSMHDDIKSFLMAVIRKVRRPCASRQSHHDLQTANAAQIATPV